MFAGGDGTSFQSEQSESLPGNRLPWLNAYNRSQETHEQYIAQKAEEIAASETIDLKSEIHGGWTMENSKKALNEFLQKTRQPSVSYHTKIKEAHACR